jgi:hypothetical protein
MTDKELLELAAKAAGYKGEYQNGGEWMNIRYGFSEAFYADDLEEYWNPLTDDGDALRLAVKLNLLVDVSEIKEETEAGDGTNGYQCELHNGDPYAATRRAIVRAAAEIGKAMP